MIRRFRHKGLEQFYMLTALQAAASPDEMKLPGYRLHPLLGDRQGYCPAWVNGNWRLVLTFNGSDATDIDLVDYH
jgi:proteic killer suppression protein